MSLYDPVPIIFRHLIDIARPHIAGVVDQDVKTAEFADCAVNDSLRSLHRSHAVTVRRRLTARSMNFGNYPLRNLRFVRATAIFNKNVIDNDLGTLCGHQQGFASTDSSASTCDDGYFALKTFRALLLGHRAKLPKLATLCPAHVLRHIQCEKAR
jgi:hypothetical protein